LGSVVSRVVVPLDSPRDLVLVDEAAALALDHRALVTIIAGIPRAPVLLGFAPVAYATHGADACLQARHLVEMALARTPLDVSVTHRLVEGRAHAALAHFDFEPNDLVLARQSCRAGRKLARLGRCRARFVEGATPAVA
jgi:hypothetical protein